MMNCTMLDMLAEDVNTPEIGNPMRWSSKPARTKKVVNAMAKTAAAGTAALSLLAALFMR